MAYVPELKVPFFRASIGKEEERTVLDVLQSGWLTTGKVTLSFEREFSDFMNRVPCQRNSAPVISLAVNSNTSGMILAMDAFGVGAGSAVITTPYTFVSTATCARHLGADVYFADIESNSYSIDPERIEEILKSGRGKNVKAIVPVHIAGNICNMKDICYLADKYGVKVIEDAAHAFPSKTCMGYAGTIGDAGVFSFYVTKTMTTAEGGMVCTRNADAARRIAAMRMHGMDRTAWDRYTSPRASWEYDIIGAGYKFNLPDILSAIGREQLKKAESMYEKRCRIVSIYNKAFNDIDFIQTPPEGDGNAWHVYLLRIKSQKLTIDRDTFARELQKAGIGISVHFIPLFHFTYWKNLYSGFRAEAFPNAEKQYKSTISLPLWPDMTDDMAESVIQAVKSIGEKFHA